MTNPRRLAVFVSGGGRSLENLAETITQGELNAEIGLVLCNKEGAFALERARRLGIPAELLDPTRELSPDEFSAAAYELCRAHDCGTVVLAGFLRLLRIPSEWEGRVLNIHPSLLPAFGGKGYYGDHVHRAVLERGVQVTGCTVHYVTEEYDAGPVLLQRAIRVNADDTVETLAARVFEEEKLALPQALRSHLEGTGDSHGS